MKRLNAWRCKRKGHDWFPNAGASEFVVTGNLCFRCGEQRHILPYGTCLGNHALSDHYTITTDNKVVMHTFKECGGPK